MTWEGTNYTRPPVEPDPRIEIGYGDFMDFWYCSVCGVASILPGHLKHKPDCKDPRKEKANVDNPE